MMSGRDAWTNGKRAHEPVKMEPDWQCERWINMEQTNALVANIVAAISLFVSLVLATYYIRDRQITKLSVEKAYVDELLSWCNDVLKTIGRLRLAAETGARTRVTELRSDLSVLIDQGRFFFPNIDKGDNFGAHKPPAFRGYRNLALDFLVAIYNIYGEEPSDENIRRAEHMRRYFLSVVFEVVNPRDRLNRIRSITDRYYSDERIYEDFHEDKRGALDYIWRK